MLEQSTRLMGLTDYTPHHTQIAREGCVALAPAAEVEACTAQLAQALDDGLPEPLRHHSLCA
jgi:hypothetical protein